MKTIQEAFTEVAEDFSYYTDEAQRTDQRRIIVDLLAEFYGTPVCDVDADLEK